MNINKITNADLENKGVIGLPDIPALSTAEMQRKFEETARDVIIPKVNEIIDNSYSKTEVNSQINQKVQEIGAGDMSKAVYDANDNGIVDIAEKAFSDSQGNSIIDTYATITGTIPKGDVTQIFVVDALPQTAVEGGLYLVRKATE